MMIIYKKCNHDPITVLSYDFQFGKYRAIIIICVSVIIKCPIYHKFASTSYSESDTNQSIVFQLERLNDLNGISFSDLITLIESTKCEESV